MSKNWKGFYTIRHLRSRCIETEEACWEWQGGLDGQGYGYVGGNQTGSRLVHRVMYILTFGMVPGGLELDHLCHNPLCCNPAHLEPVTRSENQLRRYAFEPILACRKGHPYVEGSYYEYNGKRACKECTKARDVINNKIRTQRRQRAVARANNPSE